MCTKKNKNHGRVEHCNNRFHLSCTWRFFDMLMGTVSIIGATVGWSEASDASFFPGRSMPGPLVQDHHANNAQARVEPMTNESMRRKRVAEEGSKQEAAWLTGEERGREAGRGVMMSRKDKVARGEGEK